jgi:hypothetical protein
LLQEDGKNYLFVEQMGNIGSEVGRTIKYFKKGDKKSFTIAFEKALELFDFTLEDERWHDRRKKIGEIRELFCSLAGNTVMTDKLEKEMNKLYEYFLRIGAIANEKRYRARN